MRGRGAVIHKQELQLLKGLLLGEQTPQVEDAAVGQEADVVSICCVPKI